MHGDGFSFFALAHRLLLKDINRLKALRAPTGNKMDIPVEAFVA